MLVGDETALPAIGRRVSELSARTPVITIAAVETRAERQNFGGTAAWQGHWIHRDQDGADDDANLSAAISALLPKHGDGFIWIAGEAAVAKALKEHVLVTLQHPPRSLKASGYWVRGGAGKHQRLD